MFSGLLGVPWILKYSMAHVKNATESSRQCMLTWTGDSGCCIEACYRGLFITHSTLCTSFQGNSEMLWWALHGKLDPAQPKQLCFLLARQSLPKIKVTHWPLCRLEKLMITDTSFQGFVWAVNLVSRILLAMGLAWEMLEGVCGHRRSSLQYLTIPGLEHRALLMVTEGLCNLSYTSTRSRSMHVLFPEHESKKMENCIGMAEAGEIFWFRVWNFLYKLRHGAKWRAKKWSSELWLENWHHDMKEWMILSKQRPIGSS